MSAGPRGALSGYGYMAVAALTWGSLPLIVGRAGGAAVVLVALRMGFGALALGSLLILRGVAAGRTELVPRQHRGPIFAMGVLLATSWVLFFAGIQRIGATAVLIGYLFPVLVAVLSPVVLGERREGHVLPLAGLGLAGVATMFAPHLGGGDPLGAVYALGMAVQTALLVMAARRVVQSVPGPVIAFWQYVVGAAILAPIAVLSGVGEHVPWAWGVLVGVVHTALAGVLFFRSVGLIPAPQAAVMMYLEPTSAVWFVWLIDGLVPTLAEMVGGVLVVGAGVGLVLGGRGRGPREHEALGAAGP